MARAARRIGDFLRARDGLARADYAILLLLVTFGDQYAQRHGAQMVAALAPLLGGLG